MSFFHGMQFNELVDGVRPFAEASTAVIGLIATATAAAGPATVALDAAFPLNRPVLVTDVRGAAGVAGNGGTLAKALGAIADQGQPVVVVVRVPVGVAGGGNTAQQVQDANVVGAQAGNTYTGMQALLAAEAQLGVRPRILGAPGLDSDPVKTALCIVARRLRGFVYGAARTNAAICVDVAAALVSREAFSDRELMLIWPDATGWDGQAVATALGLRAMIDARTGWHKSLSNVAIAGVSGLSKDVHFDIRDASSDAGVLNAGEITTIVRMSGYRFWGNRTCSDDAAFAFEPVVRTAQALQDGLAAIEQPFIDQPLTAGLVRQLEEAGSAWLRQLKTEGRIVGGRCYFDGAANPAAALAAGRLVIEADYTATAPLEALTTNLRVTSKYYEDFADQVASAAS